MFNDILEEYNEGTVPYIKVSDLNEDYRDVIFLDAREQKEYEVSHLPNAIFVGYKDFDPQTTATFLKDPKQTIVVYCSVGVRSEDVAHQLKEQGYLNVFNLYGGIFDWFNHKQPVYNTQNKKTDSIHAYSKSWSRYLTRGIKIYE